MFWIKSTARRETQRCSKAITGVTTGIAARALWGGKGAYTGGNGRMQMATVKRQAEGDGAAGPSPSVNDRREVSQGRTRHDTPE
jgi:hypothetical protein